MQMEALCQQGVLMGRNLVYSAPTSGGKSLVAEVLGLRRLLTTGGWVGWVGVHTEPASCSLGYRGH